MERVTLDVVKRDNSNPKQFRRNAMVPGILYGKGYTPTLVAVNEKALEAAVSTHAGINVLLDLTVEGKDKIVARIREYQAHVIKRNFTHVDFQALDLKKKIVVEVPILFDGKSKGVKEGGVLVMDRRTLAIKCLPTSIPENIVVNISELDIGDNIHVNDLKLPEGVECSHEINFPLVSVVAPMKEEVVAPVAGAVPVEGAAAAPAAAGAAAPAAGASAKPAPAAAGAKAAPAKAAAPAKEKK